MPLDRRSEGVSSTTYPLSNHILKNFTSTSKWFLPDNALHVSNQSMGATETASKNYSSKLPYFVSGTNTSSMFDLLTSFDPVLINQTKVAEEIFQSYDNATWSQDYSFDPLNGSEFWSNWTNYSDVTNNTIDGLWVEDQTILTIITAIILAFIILATIVGNVFVIAAILLEKNLQSVANYLILSLAVADLLVAALVMPLGAVYEVSKEWAFGPELCDMWTVLDVLCCTASILHLVAIALDRYWAVTNVDYIQQRSPRRVGAMIVIIWVVSTLISSAPLMGWKDSEWHGRISSNKVCLVSQDVYYQMFATMTSFYLPLGVILILYWRIYQAARNRIRRKITQSALCRGAVAISETTTFTRVSSANGSPEKSPNGALTEADRNEDALRFKMAALPLNPLALLGPRPPRKREMEARRERKAAKTLAVITGAFVICWMPFFVMALVMPLCRTCDFSPYLIATLLWLGYFNSTLNPIIYTIFSPDFRHAFRRILCGKKQFRKRQFDSRVSSMKATRS